MNAVLEHRRRLMEMGGTSTDLTGWTIGKGLTSGNYLTNDAELCVSPYYNVVGGQVIRVVAYDSYNNNHQCKFVETKSSNAVVKQQTMTAKPYNVTLQSATEKFRCVCTLSYIDDCYIYDVTNSVYLWKGKNVN